MKLTRREFLAKSARAAVGMSLAGTGVSLLTRFDAIAAPTWGASVPEHLATETLYVHPSGSDKHRGTLSQPLETIGKAAEMALWNNTKKKGTKIIINPGIYRESISLDYTKSATIYPIIFEARTPGTVVVSGSAVWTGWKPDGGGIYSHGWPYRWGLAPNPWPKDVPNLADICRRREMISVNGKWMKQVLSYRQLTEGSFFVDESRQRVYLRASVDTNMATALVEVALRPQLDGTRGIFSATGKTNLVLRGITFQHANNVLDMGAVVLTESTNLVVENCRFLWNSWMGLLVTEGKNVAIRGCVANNNGSSGMGFYKLKNMLLEDTETSYNNWRGALGEFYDWAPGGIKDSLIHGAVYRRYKSVGNKCRGFWMDTDDSNIVIENAFIHGNYFDGVFVEACQGPITIQNSIICHNGLNGDPQSSGILTGNATNLTLAGNVLYGNAASQITVNGEEPTRRETDWERGAMSIPPAKNWTMTRNRVVSEYDRDQLLFLWELSRDSWATFTKTLTSGNNLWYSRVNENAFKAAGGASLNFSQWKALINGDANSVFADPNFVNPDVHDFTRRA